MTLVDLATQSAPDMPMQTTSPAGTALTAATRSALPSIGTAAHEVIVSIALQATGVGDPAGRTPRREAPRMLGQVQRIPQHAGAVQRLDAANDAGAPVGGVGGASGRGGPGAPGARDAIGDSMVAHPGDVELSFLRQIASGSTFATKTV